MVGGTLLLVGVLLFFTPGPGLLVVPLGLSVLAAEFIWARRLLAKVKEVLRPGMAAALGRKDARDSNGGAGQAGADRAGRPETAEPARGC